jgi:hypothetical protein
MEHAVSRHEVIRVIGVIRGLLLCSNFWAAATFLSALRSYAETANRSGNLPACLGSNKLLAYGRNKD